MEEERIYGGNDVAVDLWCVHTHELVSFVE